MRDGLFGGVGFLMGLIGVLAVWLFWPLPSPRFDWQTMALEEAGKGELHGAVPMGKNRLINWP